MPRRSRPTRFGQWDVRAKLGAGGNADVYECVGVSGVVAAIKVLRNFGGDRLIRFRDEVDMLTRLKGHHGILPILDSNVPLRPSVEDPAWYAMPIARRVRDDLRPQAALSEVVEAVADFAETLADLAKQGISHRDIKPDNLFRYDDRFVVGDFGLVDFPDKVAITAENRKLGPQFYIAPEMLNDPANADGLPADVYSLAKTLWVLATGQNYPIPGEHRLDNPQARLSSYNADPQAFLLDRLMERATRQDPALRPTMEEVQQDLRAWLTSPSSAESSPDFPGVADALAARRSQAESLRRIKEQEVSLAQDLYSKFLQGLHRVREVLRETNVDEGEINPINEIEGLVNGVADRYGFTALPMPSAVWRAGASIRINLPHFHPPAAPPVGTPEVDVILLCNIGLILQEDGRAQIIAGYAMRDIAVTPDGAPPEVLWVATGRFPVQSIQCSRATDSLAQELEGNLEYALGEYNRRLERPPLATQQIDLMAHDVDLTSWEVTQGPHAGRILMMIFEGGQGWDKGANSTLDYPPSTGRYTTPPNPVYVSTVGRQQHYSGKLSPGIYYYRGGMVAGRYLRPGGVIEIADNAESGRRIATITLVVNP